VCDIIERIESYGVDLIQLQHAIKKRAGKPPGQLSAQSISMIVLGAVEEEWSGLPQPRSDDDATGH